MTGRNPERASDVSELRFGAGSVMTARRVGRRVRLVIGGCVVCLLAGFVLARPLLTAAGNMLVVEDPLAPVELIVVSNAEQDADALEAGRLYRERIAPRILLFTPPSDRVYEELRDIGIPGRDPTEFARTILEVSGVPKTAIEVLEQPVDGTGAEAEALAALAAQSKLASILYLTPRTHSGRSRWFLRRSLSPDTAVIVRSPRTDTFTAHEWWHSRRVSRQVVEQYVHWINVVVFGDLWSDAKQHDD